MTRHNIMSLHAVGVIASGWCHCERSEAISLHLYCMRLLRHFTPRNDIMVIPRNNASIIP